MALNWSGFLGGISQGIQLGNQINDQIDRNKINTIREQGLADAQAQQQQAAAAAVQENGRAVYAPDASSGTQAEAAAPAAETSAVDMPSTQTMAVDAPAPAAPAAPADPAAMPTAPGAPAATPAAAGLPRKQFEVAGQGYDNKAAATTAASKTVPTATEFFNQNAVPKIREAYLAQGNIEKAAAWDKYAADTKTQKNADTWAKAYQYSQAGQWDKAGKAFVDLHNHLDDNQTIVSTEPVKDKDGNPTGFNLTVKDDTTGEKRSQFVGHAEMLQAGLAGLSPPAMFEAAYKQQNSADALAAKAAADKSSDLRDLNKAVTVAGVQANSAANLQGMKNTAAATLQKQKAADDLNRVIQQETLKTTNIGAGEKAKVQAKVDALKAYGYDQGAIAGMVPAIVGAGDHKKVTDPTERRAIVTTQLMKDPIFNTQTPEEQGKAVNHAMNLIYGDDKLAKGSKKAITVPNPVSAAAGGLPANQNAGKTPYMTPQGIVYR